MTDGEKMVWATSFSLAVNAGSGAAIAVRLATRAVRILREVDAAKLTGEESNAVRCMVEEQAFKDAVLAAVGDGASIQKIRDRLLADGWPPLMRLHWTLHCLAMSGRVHLADDERWVPGGRI